MALSDEDLERDELIRQLRERGISTGSVDTEGGIMRTAPPLDPGVIPGEVSGIAEGEPAPSGAPATPKGRSYQEILGQYQYGPEGLLQAEKELGEQGITLQKDSGGRARGRLFLPGGRRVDVTAPNEGLDWWNAKTGTGWGDYNQGFDTGAGPSSAQSLGGGMPLTSGDTTFGAIQSLVPTDLDFQQRLQAAIAQLLGGQGAFDREALLRQLGA